MKVILAVVSSIDGKLTRWGQDDIYLWTSKEDLTYFQKLRERHNLIVMGSGTFNKVKQSGLKLQKERLRIVLTKSPNHYEKYTVLGQLEFSDESPSDLIARFDKKGYKQMLLLSGGTLNASFLQASLVDELWITLEPKIFGQGDPLVNNAKLDLILSLYSTKKLNKQGTLLLKYHILKPEKHAN